MIKFFGSLKKCESCRKTLEVRVCCEQEFLKPIIKTSIFDVEFFCDYKPSPSIMLTCWYNASHQIWRIFFLLFLLFVTLSFQLNKWNSLVLTVFCTCCDQLHRSFSPTWHCVVPRDLTNSNKQNSYLIQFGWFCIEYLLLLLHLEFERRKHVYVFVARFFYLFQSEYYPRLTMMRNTFCVGLLWPLYLLEQLWLQQYSVGIHFCKWKKRHKWK